jgi:hypothetical protein
MSLMDSLLLDPVDMEVWIAPRTDGIVGSGTEDDPYDGGVADTPAKEVASITYSAISGGHEATVTFSQPHGFQQGQIVQITRVTGADAKYYIGSHWIYSVQIAVLTAKFFANKTSAGDLLHGYQGYDGQAGSRVAELSDKVDDALGLAL